MRLTQLAAAAIVVASPLLAGPASARDNPARLPPPHSEVLRNADDAFQQAKRDCRASGVSERPVCLERARDAYAQTLAQAGVQTLPALQTQSAAVSATGIAATGVSERVHGAPEPQPRRAGR